MTPIIISKTISNTVYMQRDDGTWQTMRFDSASDRWVNGEVSGNQPTDAVDTPGIADSITISVSDPAHQAEAVQAAANVLAGLDKIRAYFADESLNSLIQFNGQSITVGSVLDMINNTQFIITDQAFTNGGVGSAVRMSDGSTVDTLNFEYFDGDGNDYASPSYSNMGGNGWNIIARDGSYDRPRIAV